MMPALRAWALRGAAGRCKHCGRWHVGGDDACWLLHPAKVPESMKTMLPAIHAKRAAKGLPDLSGRE